MVLDALANDLRENLASLQEKMDAAASARNVIARTISEAASAKDTKSKSKERSEAELQMALSAKRKCLLSLEDANTAVLFAEVEIEKARKERGLAQTALQEFKAGPLECFNTLKQKRSGHKVAEAITLAVVSPNGQSERAGMYELTGQSHNNFPVWKQSGGENAIYTYNGFWLIGPESSMATGEGGITSAVPHEGHYPCFIEKWELACDGAWHYDAAIEVSQESWESCLSRMPVEGDRVQRLTVDITKRMAVFNSQPARSLLWSLLTPVAISNYGIPVAKYPYSNCANSMSTCRVASWGPGR